MKRVLTMVCAIALSFSLAACSSVHEITPEEIAEEEAWKNSCVEMDYDTLAHSASNMKGQRVKITGKIFQVVNNTFSKTYMFDMYLIEGDRVSIYGTIEGTQTYITILGAQRTVPKVAAKYIVSARLPNQITSFPDGSYIETNPNTGESIYHPAPQYQY